MVGQVAKSVAYGCAQALKWILWLTAGLLLILIIVQYFRGDTAAKPMANLILMAVFAVAGIISHFIGKKIADA